MWNGPRNPKNSDGRRENSIKTVNVAREVDNTCGYDDNERFSGALHKI